MHQGQQVEFYLQDVEVIAVQCRWYLRALEIKIINNCGTESSARWDIVSKYQTLDAHGPQPPLTLRVWKRSWGSHGIPGHSFRGYSLRMPEVSDLRYLKDNDNDIRGGAEFACRPYWHCPLPRLLSFASTQGGKSLGGKFAPLDSTGACGKSVCSCCSWGTNRFLAMWASDELPLLPSFPNRNSANFARHPGMENDQQHPMVFLVPFWPYLPDVSWVATF